MGTFPAQLYESEVSLGKLMTVMSDEDELTSKAKITLRLNKLKAVVRYFCVFYKRSILNKAIVNEMIIFQRYTLSERDQSIENDCVRFCSVEVRVG
jgi:hypothetical protein